MKNQTLVVGAFLFLFSIHSAFSGDDEVAKKAALKADKLVNPTQVRIYDRLSLEDDEVQKTITTLRAKGKATEEIKAAVQEIRSRYQKQRVLEEEHKKEEAAAAALLEFQEAREAKLNEYRKGRSLSSQIGLHLLEKIPVTETRFGLLDGIELTITNHLSHLLPFCHEVKLATQRLEASYRDKESVSIRRQQVNLERTLNSLSEKLKAVSFEIAFNSDADLTENSYDQDYLLLINDALRALDQSEVYLNELEGRITSPVKTPVSEKKPEIPIQSLPPREPEQTVASQKGSNQGARERRFGLVKKTAKAVGTVLVAPLAAIKYVGYDGIYKNLAEAIQKRSGEQREKQVKSAYWRVEMRKQVSELNLVVPKPVDLAIQNFIQNTEPSSLFWEVVGGYLLSFEDLLTKMETQRDSLIQVKNRKRLDDLSDSLRAWTTQLKLPVNPAMKASPCSGPDLKKKLVKLPHFETLIQESKGLVLEIEPEVLAQERAVAKLEQEKALQLEREMQTALIAKKAEEKFNALIAKRVHKDLAPLQKKKGEAEPVKEVTDSREYRYRKWQNFIRELKKKPKTERDESDRILLRYLEENIEKEALVDLDEAIKTAQTISKSIIVIEFAIQQKKQDIQDLARQDFIKLLEKRIKDTFENPLLVTTAEDLDQLQADNRKAYEDQQSLQKAVQNRAAVHRKRMKAKFLGKQSKLIAIDHATTGLSQKDWAHPEILQKIKDHVKSELMKNDLLKKEAEAKRALDLQADRHRKGQTHAEQKSESAKNLLAKTIRKIEGKFPNRDFSVGLEEKGSSGSASLLNPDEIALDRDLDFAEFIRTQPERRLELAQRLEQFNQTSAEQVPLSKPERTVSVQDELEELTRTREIFDKSYHPFPAAPCFTERVEETCPVCGEFVDYSWIPFSQIQNRSVAENRLIQIPTKGSHKFSTCGHLIHESCFEIWRLQKQGRDYFCPVCKAGIPFHEHEPSAWRKAFGFHPSDFSFEGEGPLLATEANSKEQSPNETSRNPELQKYYFNLRKEKEALIEKIERLSKKPSDAKLVQAARDELNQLDAKIRPVHQEYLKTFATNRESKKENEQNSVERQIALQDSKRKLLAEQVLIQEQHKLILKEISDFHSRVIEQLPAKGCSLIEVPKSGKRFRLHRILQSLKVQAENDTNSLMNLGLNRFNEKLLSLKQAEGIDLQQRLNDVHAIDAMIVSQAQDLVQNYKNKVSWWATHYKDLFSNQKLMTKAYQNRLTSPYFMEPHEVALIGSSVQKSYQEAKGQIAQTFKEFYDQGKGAEDPSLWQPEMKLAPLTQRLNDIVAEYDSKIQMMVQSIRKTDWLALETDLLSRGRKLTGEDLYFRVVTESEFSTEFVQVAPFQVTSTVANELRKRLNELKAEFEFRVKQRVLQYRDHPDQALNVDDLGEELINPLKERLKEFELFLTKRSAHLFINIQVTRWNIETTQALLSLADVGVRGTYVTERNRNFELIQGALIQAREGVEKSQSFEGLSAEVARFKEYLEPRRSDLLQIYQSLKEIRNLHVNFRSFIREQVDLAKKRLRETEASVSVSLRGVQLMSEFSLNVKEEFNSILARLKSTEKHFEGWRYAPNLNHEKGVREELQLDKGKREEVIAAFQALISDMDLLQRGARLVRGAMELNQSLFYFDRLVDFVSFALGEVPSMEWKFISKEEQYFLNRLSKGGVDYQQLQTPQIEENLNAVQAHFGQGVQAWLSEKELKFANLPSFPKLLETIQFEDLREFKRTLSGLVKKFPEPLGMGWFRFIAHLAAARPDSQDLFMNLGTFLRTRLLKADRFSFKESQYVAPSIPIGFESYPGLVNFGNTCYLNSIIKALSMTALGDLFDPLKIGSKPHSAQAEARKSLALLINRIHLGFPSLENETLHVLSAVEKLLSNSNDTMERGIQRDAPEILGRILDELDFNENTRRQYQIEIASYLKATPENYSGMEVKPSPFLLLPIAGDRSVQTSLNQYLRPHQDRKIEDNQVIPYVVIPGIVSAPKTLILQMERFKWNGIKKSVEKISTPVILDDQLVLSVQSLKSAKEGHGFSNTTRPYSYRFKGAIAHEGTSPQRGHYYYLSCEEECWVHEDDKAPVRWNRDSEVWNSRAYLLFYERME